MSALLLSLLLAAAAGADPHSFGNPESVRPRHLSLDLTLSFPRKVASVESLLSRPAATSP